MIALENYLILFSSVLFAYQLYTHALVMEAIALLLLLLGIGLHFGKQQEYVFLLVHLFCSVRERDWSGAILFCFIFAAECTHGTHVAIFQFHFWIMWCCVMTYVVLPFSKLYVAYALQMGVLLWICPTWIGIFILFVHINLF